MFGKYRLTFLVLATCFMAVASQTSAASAQKFEVIYTWAESPEYYVEVNINNYTPSGTHVYVFVFSRSQNYPVLRCNETIDGGELSVNGDATMGSAAVNLVELCSIGMASDVSLDCTSDGEYQHHSVGYQTIKTPTGTTKFHGHYKESSVMCTITIDGQIWNSTGGQMAISRDRG